MSLKAFHIFFIILSKLMLLGVGIWQFLVYHPSGGRLHLMLALLAFISSIGLTIYLALFLKKTKNLKQS